jgi:hypothetical protein
LSGVKLDRMARRVWVALADVRLLADSTSNRTPGLARRR